MNRRLFDQCVRQVMESLPPAFAPYLVNLVVDVEEEPTLAMLRDLDFSAEEIAEGESLYGLFVPSEFDTGDGLGGVDAIDQPPHRIIIFRRPLLEDFPELDDLKTEIRKTVIHELAHHFGWTDRDLAEFDDNPNPFKD